MLSILIPTYNYDARALVEAFTALASREHMAIEILIGDDASTADTAWLDAVEQMMNVSVLRTEENLGRARNRNRMADIAKGEWLLFVDSDALVENDFSLKAYLDATSLAPVICGGVRHPATNPNPEATLRYKYERRADRERSAACRTAAPYDRISTFNLLVRRDVFLQIRFDEACKEYGYEDTLFGAELERRGYAIQHIDNPLVHIGLESNDVFLKKSETALRTLKHLGRRMECHSRIVATANYLSRLHLIWLVVAMYKLFGPMMKMNLLSRYPSLTLFQCYKLGYYLSL